MSDWRSKMKSYIKPVLLSSVLYSKNEAENTIFPSTGALTGAVSMVARSAARSNALEKDLKPLQKVENK